ncbi:sensor histidine kinase [Cryptosporangium arvum]|uniref:sensor histidine kinase n=1 Tax=Cryptosporangium arvum TaxID=80871 RepID=UPI0006849DDF|nr:histidine kinase [Cryptosporangium arvum]
MRLPNPARLPRWARSPLWVLITLGAYLPLALAGAPTVLKIDSVWLIGVAGAMALAFWLLRGHPVAAWYTAAALALVLPNTFEVLDDDPWQWPPLLGFTLIAAYANISARAPRRQAAWAWVIAPGLFWAYANADARAGWIVLLVAIPIVADVGRTLRRTRTALGRERELTEAEKARTAVLEERARIARDLHDVVAHHMSMVVVQAETAPYRLAGLSPEATADFAAISTTAREALNEVRGLLGVLRSEEISADLRPQPGCDDLPELIAGAVRAGADVEFTRTGEPRKPRPGVDVGAYRIVQESLANAARHAPGASARVTLAYTADALEITVVNGKGAQQAEPHSAGHGLVGMTERATVVGGELRAAPTPEGGFAVRARLPLEPSEK